MMRFPLVACVTACLAAGAVTLGQTPAPADLSAAIGALGSFDLATRTNAARSVRRADPAVVAPQLERAARSHADEYVRFRALVLLSGFSGSALTTLMNDMMGDRNDRLRTVAYQWHEQHVVSAALPSLIAALPRELSEFVRPALTRALAAHGGDERAQAVLKPLVTRGEDLFRGSVIEALGDSRARYAVEDILSVAKLEGPLQDDAITALGKIGDTAVVSELAAIRRTARAELQPTLSASFALLGVERPTHEAFVRQSLAHAAGNGPADVLRGAVHAAAMLGAADNDAAVAALFDAGLAGDDDARESVALGLGLVALRHPLVVLRVLERRAQPDREVDLLLEAFDMLSEDFAEEQFYVEIRRAYWDAAEGSARRRVAERMLDRLEFS